MLDEGNGDPMLSKGSGNTGNSMIAVNLVVINILL